MKLHGIKIITLQNVDVAMEDAEFEVTVENDSVWVHKDVEGPADVSITKRLLFDTCVPDELVTIAQWCNELIAEEYKPEEPENE